VSHSYLHEIESGKKNPTRTVVSSLDKCLGAGGLLTALHSEEDPVKRRAIFEVLALMTAGGLEHTRLFNGLTNVPPARVGSSDVDAVSEAIKFCTSLDLQHGGPAAVGPGRSVLAWAMGLLDAQMAENLRRRLNCEVAALADRVAWASYDAGKGKAASDIYAVALRLAHEGRDRNLVAHVLIDASTYASHYGEHAKAADLLHAAVGDNGLSPAVRANVGMTYARHIAHLGRSNDALAEVERSTDIATRLQTEAVPSWSKGFLANPGHLPSVAARAYLFAGDYEQAIQGFTAALGALDSQRGRGRAYALCLLATAYLRGGYSDLAHATAAKAVNAAPGIKSLRVAGHMRALADSFAAGHHHEMARTLLAASQSVEPIA